MGLHNTLEEEEAEPCPGSPVVALHKDHEERRRMNVPATEELSGHSWPSCPDWRGLGGGGPHVVAMS